MVCRFVGGFFGWLNIGYGRFRERVRGSIAGLSDQCTVSVDAETRQPFYLRQDRHETRDASTAAIIEKTLGHLSCWAGEMTLGH